MQFNTHSDNQDLISDITFLTGVDTNKYSLKDRTRSINEWNRKVWTWAFEAYGGWQFDDDNTTSTSDTPDATVNLVSGTAIYGLPAGTLTIRKADILLDDGSTWQPLKPLPLESIGWAEGELLKTSGIPIYYRPVGDVVKLYPAPNYTETGGLKIFFDRDMATFVSTDTTATPGFASPFHRILPIGASLDYALANGINNKAISLSNLAIDYERRLKKFYSKRFLDNFPPTMRVTDSVAIYK